MILFNLYKKEKLICPAEKDEVGFWTKKWGVSAEQLNEAILETGSINVKEIKNYLVDKGFVFSFSKMINHIRTFQLKNNKQ